MTIKPQDMTDDYNREALAYIASALGHLGTAKAYFNHDRPRTVQGELCQARADLKDAIAKIDEWEESLM